MLGATPEEVSSVAQELLTKKSRTVGFL